MRGLGGKECTPLPQVLLADISFTPFRTRRAVAIVTIGSATLRLADIGPCPRTRLESRHVDSPRHVSAGASVPRDQPDRPSIPEPTPCACSSADAAEAKYRGSGCSRRVAQATGRPEVCPEGQAAGGVCPAASRQGWLEGRCRCAVQELPSCWWSMPSCWWVCPSVYSACELCVCSVPGFSEALETFYTAH